MRKRFKLPDNIFDLIGTHGVYRRLGTLHRCYVMGAGYTGRGGPMLQVRSSQGDDYASGFNIDPADFLPGADLEHVSLRDFGDFDFATAELMVGAYYAGLEEQAEEHIYQVRDEEEI